MMAGSPMLYITAEKQLKGEQLDMSYTSASLTWMKGDLSLIPKSMYKSSPIFSLMQQVTFSCNNVLYMAVR